MLLSIGMIVKNEEKYLHDCLTGLQPILEQVHSELIIYDTGSTDTTVEIAKKFTDKVYHCEWRGDFAWARNHTVDRAIGKWYMFVDADEVFEDTKDLIRFFNTEEYKQYECACLRMRSVVQSATDNIFFPTRLFKLRKGLRFVGKIHEYMPGKPPMKRLSSFINHYGYGQETEEIIAQKKERNLVPLLELHEKEPQDLRHINHIINEYGSKEDADEKKRFIDLGLDIVGDDTDNMYFHIFQYKLMSYYHGQKEWDATIDAVKNYLLKSNRLTKVTLLAQTMEALALGSQKKYAEAAHSYIKVLDYYKKDEEGLTDDAILLIETLAMPIKNVDHAIDSIMYNFSMAEDFDAALEWNKKRESSKSHIIFSTYADKIIADKHYEGFATLYNFAASRYEADTIMYNEVIDAIEYVLTDPKLINKVADAILTDNKNDSADDYIHFMQLRKHRRDEDFNYFLAADRPWLQRYADVIAMAIEEKRDFSLFIKNLEVEDMPRFMGQVFRCNKDINDIFTDYLLNEYIENGNLKYHRLMTTLAMLMYERIKTTADMKKDDDVDKLVIFNERYVRLRFNYLTQIYQADIFCDAGIDALSEQDQYIYFAAQGFICKDKGDAAGFARNMRMALRANRGMKDIIQRIGSQIKEQEEVPVSANDQLAQEIAKLKAVFNTLILSGNKENAAAVLNMYMEVNPSDPDIENLKRQLA